MTVPAKLKRKEELAVAALLTAPTVAEAAKAAGISEPTLYRWLRRADFQSAYRAARRQLIEVAVGRLQQASADAVATLRRALNCGSPGAEIRAAVAVLDHAYRGAELIDFEQRLTALEQAKPEVPR